MRSKLQIILIVLTSVVQQAITARTNEKCHALNRNQLRKSCSVCRKYFKQQNHVVQAYRIKAACFSLSLNKCCGGFRFEENPEKRASLSVLDSEESSKYLRHMNHGIDLI